MIKVRVSGEEDREKLIACANGAFGDSIPESGFPGLLPKLYGPEARVGGNHLIAEEDGTFLGIVLAEPMEYRILGERLRIAGVGTVSVDGQARGRGIMRLLMDETVKRLKGEKYAFAFLGGQRQRYAYWGFEGCGTEMRFSWNQANLKHGVQLPESERIELVPMGTSSGEGVGLKETDTGLTEAAWRMWQKEAVAVERDRERFFSILCSWQGKPYACMRQGRFVGYVVLSREEGRDSAGILELVLEEGVSVTALLRALADCLGILQGTLKPGYARQDMLRELEEICEGESLGCGHRFLILDWCLVLRAMMALKQSSHPLEDGEAILRIRDGEGRTEGIWIQVREGCLRVAEETERKPAATEEGGKEPVQVEFTASQAVRMLFRSTQVHYKELEGLPGSWFPLPLYVGEQDCC